MMADPTYQFPQHPHRKPFAHLHIEQQRPYPSSPSSSTFSHSHTRTTSSSIFPGAPQPNLTSNPNNGYQNNFTSKRTPSTSTFSTMASSGNGPMPQRQGSTDLRRSTSSRSGGSQQASSYVALMRKQKATVWCDRAQQQKPQLLAAQRAAKLRADMEVHGGAAVAGRTSTSGSGSMVGSNRVTAKIRHHGKATLVGYAPAGNFGIGVGGVPMRLSASEVEGGDSDEDAESGAGGMYHHRSGSGRSSVSSARRGLTYARQSGSGASGRWSSGHTPPSEREGSLNGLAEETPVPAGHVRQKDYFAKNDGSTHSAGSGSSGERRDGLGDLDTPNDAARLASNSLLKATITREKSTKNPDELRRRGSVDDRTMTMSAGRLFVANPDVDSD